MYLYETHLHTVPVSTCAKSTVREALEFYKELGYTGVFITNHFIDGNINIDKASPYEDKINFYFSDYEEAARLSDEIGIAVFCGVETSYKGADFLVYGLDKQWYLDHPTSSGGAQLDVDMSVSLTTGLFFLFMSLIFKHGAEVQKSAEQAAEKNAPCDE